LLRALLNSPSKYGSSEAGESVTFLQLWSEIVHLKFNEKLRLGARLRTAEYRETPPARHAHACGRVRRSGAMLLMATAMRTTTLRLGSAVIVLPWHNKVADTWFQPVK
jgi:hypothetical protein